MTAGRILRGGLLGIGILILLAVIGVWWLVATDAGARRVVAYALGKSPDGLEIAEVHGPLRGPLLLLGVEYRSGGLSAEVDTVLLDFRLRPLLQRRVQFDRLHVSGMRVILPDSAPPDTLGTTDARRERPKPPFPVILGEVLVRRFELDGPRNTSIRDGSLRLSGTLEDYSFDITGTAVLPNVDTVFTRLAGRGDLVGVALDSSTTRLLTGDLAGTGEVRWWPRIEWDLTLRGARLQPSLLLEDPATLPGTVSFRAITSGAIEAQGPAGQVVVDSLGGTLRGQPLRGQVEARFGGAAVDLPHVDIGWGSAGLRAEGRVGDTVSVTYHLAVSNLRPWLSAARGSLNLDGRAHGPRLTPQVTASLRGRDIGYLGNRFQRLTGRADVNLARRGRISLTLQADSGRIGRRAVDKTTLVVRGTQGRHRLTSEMSAGTDTLRALLAGGLQGGTWQAWRGRIDTLGIRSALEDWHLERPAALSLSTRSARLQPLCLVADTATGRLCAEGTWERVGRWNLLATVDSLSLSRFPLLAGPPLSGMLNARVEARTTGPGAVATLDARVDDEGSDAVVWSGRATWPGYRAGAGRSLMRAPMEARLEGRIPDLTYAEPMFVDMDSLRGALALEVDATGTMRAPHLSGALRIERFAGGLSRNRSATGSVELTADLSVRDDRTLSGEARLIPHDVAVAYQGVRRHARLTLGGAGVTLRVGGDGLRGTLELTVASDTATQIGTAAGDLALPQYTRLGAPLGPQPVTLRLAAKVDDLGATQPLLTPLDSLRGRVQLDLSVDGKVGMPIIKGTLRLEEAQGMLPSGTIVRGGLNGDLDVVVASDSTITGTLRMEPRGVTFTPVGDTASVIHLQNAVLDARTGADGVHAQLDATLGSDGDGSLATIRGRGALPRYTRVGRPLSRQPVEATVEGRVDDFAFLPAFTDQVDSAAGHMTLDARLTGTLGESRLVGGVELGDVAMRMPLVGILLHDLQLTATGDQQGSIKVDGRMRSGGGELTIDGSTPVQPTSEEPGRFRIRGTRFEAANNAVARAVVSPNLEVRLAGDSLFVSGEVDVPLARVEIHDLPVTALAPSDDVVLLDSLMAPRKERPITAQVRVTLGDSVSLEAFNFDAELGGSIVLRQAPDELPTATGSLVIEEGFYRAWGQDLTIRNGVIRFAGGPVDNPGLSMRATRTISDTMTVGIAIGGTLKDPNVRLFSEPPMSDSQVLAYIVTGAPLGRGAGAGANILEKTFSTLGLLGGTALSRRVGDKFGLDEARIETRGDLQDASLVIGRYLSPKVYVSYGIGVFDPVSTLRLRYVLSNRFTLQAETGTETSADALVRIRKGKP